MMNTKYDNLFYYSKNKQIPDKIIELADEAGDYGLYLSYTEDNNDIIYFTKKLK